MLNTDSPISQFMTAQPFTIESTASLALARQKMQVQRLRHLPVEEAGKLVGILTERDLYVLAYFPDIDFNTATVGFAMEKNLYCVKASAALSEVAAAMAERRIGSALVLGSNEELLGIFTDTDALRALAC